jgi:dephospho-CoA kinase
MWILGLTGAIGAGKSTIASFFRQLGVPVQCSDQEIHSLLNTDVNVQEKIRALWPKAFVNGRLSRLLLGDCVSSSPYGLETLEGILYPKIAQGQKKFLLKNQRNGVPVVVLDVPLLFEVGLDSYCHRVILATAPVFLRKQRVLSRQGMGEEKFRFFEFHQMAEKDRIKRADFVIRCGLDKGRGLKKIQEILDTLIQELDPKWHGKWPINLERKRNGSRNCIRHRNDRF